MGNEEGTFPTQKAIGQGEGSIELSEERRLCYVAMTRAKTHLVLTWRREVSYFAGNSFKTKDADRSRFLNVLVSKGGDKGRKNTHGMKAVADNKARKPPAGTRMIHTEVARSGSSPLQRDRNNFKSAKELSTANSRSNKYTTQAGSRSNRAYPSKQQPPHSANRKSWDDWEPTKLQKPIQQVPSIKPMVSVANNHKQRSLSSRQVSTRKAPASNTRQINYGDTNIQKQQFANRMDSPPQKDADHAFNRDAPPEIDSTIFYPVGSSVKHKYHGKGRVQSPPASDDEFAEKMLVRVRFENDNDIDYWDLPMDSLVHTYE